MAAARKDIDVMADRREWWGWMLFLVSAVMFLAMGIRDRDILLVAGSAVFLAACAVFLSAHRRR